MIIFLSRFRSVVGKETSLNFNNIFLVTVRNTYKIIIIIIIGNVIINGKRKRNETREEKKKNSEYKLEIYFRTFTKIPFHFIIIIIIMIMTIIII